MKIIHDGMPGLVVRDTRPFLLSVHAPDIAMTRDGPPFRQPLYNFCVGIYWHLESSTQALREEAVNLLSEKHRLNRIA